MACPTKQHLTAQQVYNTKQNRRKINQNSSHDKISLLTINNQLVKKHTITPHLKCKETSTIHTTNKPYHTILVLSNTAESERLCCQATPQ